MQCVILAAGRGTRMMELTGAVPKPMLDVEGKPLLEYKIDALPETVTEVILIIGYLKEVVQHHFGSSFNGRKITYVEQKELNGTAGALWAAQSILHDRFLIMMGDDIYTKEDVARCIESSDHWRLLVQHADEMQRAGLVIIGEDGNITDIIESKKEDEVRKGEGVASTNLYVLDTRLFSCKLIPKHEGSLEYGLPQTVVAAARELDITLEPIFTEKWIQITSPKDLVYASRMLKSQGIKP